jgi:hypothetical protein
VCVRVRERVRVCVQVLFLESKDVTRERVIEIMCVCAETLNSKPETRNPKPETAKVEALQRELYSVS